MNKNLLFILILVGATSFSAQAQQKTTPKKPAITTPTPTANSSRTRATTNATHMQQVVDAKKKNAAISAGTGVFVGEKVTTKATTKVKNK
jgi:parvulin-like peptidyl-prolyl isomerase